MDGGFVLILGQMPVNTVVAGIDQTALEPLVAGCVTGIEYFVPVLVPSQQVGRSLQQLGKFLRLNR